MKTYEIKAAELVKQLGYDAMAKEILEGKQSAFRTFSFLRNVPAFDLMGEKQQMIIKAALYALAAEESKAA